MSHFIILLSLSFVFLCNSQAKTVDQDQLDLEKNKALTVFNLGPYIADVNAMNSIGEDDYFEEDQRELNTDWMIESAEKWRQTEAAKTDADRLAEKLKKEQEETRISKIEKEIGESIRRFIDKHPNDKANLITVYKAHKKAYLADISGKIGDHFRKIGRVDDADYFYDLAYKGFQDYTSNGSQSSQGYMHLDLYNREIAETKPKRPTASLYYHLKQAVAALSVASSMDEVAEFSIKDLFKIRNMIFRWHLSAQALQVDTYYDPGNLVKMVYARGFVNRVLQQAEAFRVFKNANRYDGSMTNTDLAKYLKKLAFCGVWQAHSQHNWVHPNGFMVRVKRIDKGEAQFTIGLTFENPVVWNADGTPRSLKQHANGVKLVFDKTNEVLKLAYDGKAVFVVPAFRAFYWFNAGQVDPMMNMSHFPLARGFGHKTGPFSYNTKAVEALLDF